MSRARDLSNFVNPAAISVDGSFNVGINSVTPDVKLDVVGVVSATSFTGDGANITNISADGLTGTPDIDIRNITGTAGTFSGPVNIDDTTESTSTSTGALIVDGGVGIAKSLRVGGNLSVGGTVTYEDVTNVDSIGVITARSGVHFGTQAAGTLVTGNATGIGIGAATPAAGIQLGDTQATSGIQFGTGVDFTIKREAGSAGVVFNVGSDLNNYQIDVGGSEKVRINSGGDVGIGTTIPRDTLDVVGGIQAESLLTVRAPVITNDVTNLAGTGVNLWTQSTVPAGEWFPALTWTGNSGAQNRSRAGITAISEAAVNVASSLIFMTRNAADGSSLTPADEKVRITSSGNVGIGTNTPIQKLHLASSGSGNVSLNITNDTTGHSSGNGAEFSLGADEQVQIWNYENTFFRIATNNDEKVRVSAGGSMGIGTNDPECLLHLEGNKSSATRAKIILADNQSGNGDFYFESAGSGSENHLVIGEGGDPMILVVGDTAGGGTGTRGFVGINSTSPERRLDVLETVSQTVAQFQTTGQTKALTRYECVGDQAVFVGAARSDFNIEMGGSDAMTIDHSNKNVSLTGNIIFPDGKGINFGASQGGGATSDLLDDYEEGTFTPSYSTGITSPVYTDTVYGTYVKIGKIVTFGLFIRASGGTESTTTRLSIDGLPFTSASPASTGAQGGAFFTYTQNFIFNSGGPIPTLYISPNTTRVQFYNDQGGDWRGDSGQGIVSAYLYIRGQYEVA